MFCMSNIFRSDIHLYNYTLFFSEAIFYVLFIEFYDFFEVCDVASSTYLPHSGKSRLGCEASTVMKFVFIPFVYCWWAGSD